MNNEMTYVMKHEMKHEMTHNMTHEMKHEMTDEMIHKVFVSHDQRTSIAALYPFDIHKMKRCMKWNMT